MNGSMFTRRRFLASSASAVAGAFLAGCSSSPQTTPRVISPTDRAITDAEATRRRPGSSLTTVDLVAGPATVDLAGRVVDTVAYNQQVPGPLIRARAGDELKVTLRNQLDAATLTHWHGLAIRNDMDGVPDLVQAAIEPGASFTYQFIVPDPGTYWFHPHMGLDLDRGMYAPIIIDDPDEAGDYDHEEVLILDDWLDGIDGATPESTLEQLRSQGGMGGMSGMNHSGMDGMSMSGMSDFGDVDYPLHLINGRPPADAPSSVVAPGSRVRLRFINAGSDTVYRVAVDNHPMLITHLDGFPIEPVEVDTFQVAMGERVDAIVEVTSGVWPILAVAEGKTGAALTWLRTTDTAATATQTLGRRLANHDGRMLDLAAARPTAGVARSTVTPERSLDLALTGSMTDYVWGINGRTYDPTSPLLISSGETLRLGMRNETMMVHPMHLHGHTFALTSSGVRKDTVLVPPMETVEIDVLADNPGQWMLHCHNTYHLETGMATVLAYRT
ncbi:MAG: multicopper oxidase family protein [Acidimicrobiia bacterium]|nr:multicopper oxidase family protein [Acidimicrobiia bacterium]